MAKVTIPVQAALTRTDGSTLALTDLASIDAFLSVDGNAFTSLPALAPGATEIVIDGLDPGSDCLVDVDETDTQVPPAISAKARVRFTIPVPRLADPTPPTLGAPVIS